MRLNSITSIKCIEEIKAHGILKAKCKGKN